MQIRKNCCAIGDGSISATWLKPHYAVLFYLIGPTSPSWG